jgi:short subunit dehydrogenase-like uncharacterized protein
MDPLFHFMLGASIVSAIVCAILYGRTHTALAIAERDTEHLQDLHGDLTAKISHLEELQRQAEQRIAEYVRELQKAGAYIQHLKMHIGGVFVAKCEHADPNDQPPTPSGLN